MGDIGGSRYIEIFTGAHFMSPDGIEKGKALKDYNRFVMITPIDCPNSVTIGGHPSLDVYAHIPIIGAAGKPGYNVSFSTDESLADILAHFNGWLHQESRVSLIWNDGEEKRREDYETYGSWASFDSGPRGLLERVIEYAKNNVNRFMLKDISNKLLRELEATVCVSFVCKQDVDQTKISRFWYDRKTAHRPNQTCFTFNTPTYILPLFELAYGVTNFGVTKEDDAWIREIVSKPVQYHPLEAMIHITGTFGTQPNLLPQED